MIKSKQKFLLSDEFRKSVNTSYRAISSSWKSISEDIEYLNTTELKKTNQEMFEIFEDINCKIDTFIFLSSSLRDDLHAALSQAYQINSRYISEC